MKFIEFDNRIINLDAIAEVMFDAETVADIHIRFLDGRKFITTGDRAVELWALLKTAIATEAASDKFAALAATAILSDFGRNGGADDH